MIDMGIRYGSSTWAVPVIVTNDKVYVHSNIEQVTEMNGKPVTDCYKYNEVQYEQKEYIEHIGNENVDLKQQLITAQTQVTDTQLALCDVYELIGG